MLPTSSSRRPCAAAARAGRDPARASSGETIDRGGVRRQRRGSARSESMSAQRRKRRAADLAAQGAGTAGDRHGARARSGARERERPARGVDRLAAATQDGRTAARAARPRCIAPSSCASVSVSRRPTSAPSASRSARRCGARVLVKQVRDRVVAGEPGDEDAAAAGALGRVLGGVGGAQQVGGAPAAAAAARRRRTRRRAAARASPAGARRREPERGRRPRRRAASGRRTRRRRRGRRASPGSRRPPRRATPPRRGSPRRRPRGPCGR